ncbi:MAG: dihydrofolate reductase family protein [Solirubrobacterales bacterium]
MSGRVRGYLGMSLDGRIADPGDDLGWLDESRPRAVGGPVPATAGEWLSYEDFTAAVGVLLMGRRTFDVVSGFDEWFYGELAVLVATHRPLPASSPPTVTSISGTVDEVVAEARRLSGGNDVYVDGGQLVCAVLDAGLLDELTTTVLPTVRGPGVGLFDALRGPHELELVRVATNEGGAVQLTWVTGSAA